MRLPGGYLLHTIEIGLERRDLWVGCFWTHDTANVTWVGEDDKEFGMRMRVLRLYVCLIPCVPLRFTLARRRRGDVIAAPPGMRLGELEA